MIRIRRRHKRILVATAVVLLGTVLFLQVKRYRVERYRAGERTEGIVDTLARDAPVDHPPVRFDEVSTEAGLVFRHFSGVRGNRLPEDMGSGVALGDVNGDGWTDAFLVNVSGPLSASDELDRAPSRLFLNRGDGTFEDVTASCGIALAGLCNGAAFLDVDSDGDLDLFVTAYGTCALFENDGDANFVDVSRAAGLGAWEGFWAGVAVADYDLDGAMDVYVTGYVEYDESLGAGGGMVSQYDKAIPALINPSTFEPHRNLLLKGSGDGRFEDVAEAAGVVDAKGRGLGALFCDLDADGYPDLYVANDVSDNALFLNRGDGTFADYTAPALVGDYRGAMGLAAADFDGDLDLDVFVTHWVGQENALYVQSPGPVDEDGESIHPIFFDEADRYGLGHAALSKVGWATRFFDFDNDGRLDLFVVNGSTIPVADEPERLVPMRTQLFWNAPEGRGFFHEVGEASGAWFSEEHVGRGGATFDHDLDGDEDLLVVTHGEQAALLRNEGGNARPSVRVRLRQPEGNRFAVGARVVVRTGDRRAMELIGSQGSYLSQHAVGEVGFGLGDAALVDEIEVTWPDGEREAFGPLLPYSLVTWTRGALPRVEPLPGRHALDADGPIAVEDQRRFFAIRSEAQRMRLDGDYDAAIERYLEALLLWPGHTDCLYYLANSWITRGREDLALAALERAAHFQDQHSPTWMQIGFLRLPGGDERLDDLEQAERAFARSHELNQEESRPTLMLGEVALLRGQHERAAELFAAAARQNPRSVEARWFAGRVAFLQGDVDRAAEWLAQARELAGVRGAGESPSNEGDTASGAAMTSAASVPLDPSLLRWRSLSERDGDVGREYDL